jgi:uncharacterized membrane protein
VAALSHQFNNNKMRQLKAITQRALIVALFFSILSAFRPMAKTEATHANADTADVKAAALVILKNRCNTCHAWQNPGKVFTEANMNSLAPKIHEQVFIRKRMPRGKARLSEKESDALRSWLSTQNID